MTKKIRKSSLGQSAETRPGVALPGPEMWRRFEDALNIANDPNAFENLTFQAWVTRIQNFSTLAETASGLQSVAVIGSALIAKATNLAINPFCLRANASVSGAYNARGPAEKVLYPASLIHRFDIGSNSANPLNGQTFNKLKIIDKTLVIRGGQQLVNPLNDLLHAISLVPTTPDAVLALAAYVQVRRNYARKPSLASGEIGITNTISLCAAVSVWVSEDSEGGGRAQAAVGGILDAIYGTERVRVGKPNEPDREIAGDVIVWKDVPDTSTGVSDFSPGAVALAIEVRDKAVTDVDCLSVLRKLEGASVTKGAIVAIAKSQDALRRDAIETRALEFGVHLELYTDWGLFVGQAALWSQKGNREIAELAVDAIRSRAEQIRISPNGIAAWNQLTRSGGTG